MYIEKVCLGGSILIKEDGLIVRDGANTVVGKITWEEIIKKATK